MVRHAEVDGHQQVELALAAPRRATRPPSASAPPSSPRSLPMHAVVGAEQVLEEILVPLARRAQQVRAPDEQVARPVLRIVRVLAGHLQLAGFQLLGDIVLDLLAGRLGGLGHLQRIGLQLRRRGQPAHALGADVVVDQAAVPVAFGRGRRQDLACRQRLVAPLVGVGVPGTRSSSCAAADGSSRARRPAAASRSAGAAFPGPHSAPSRRRTGRRNRTSPAC